MDSTTASCRAPDGPQPPTHNRRRRLLIFTDLRNSQRYHPHYEIRNTFFARITSIHRHPINTQTQCSVQHANLSLQSPLPAPRSHGPRAHTPQPPPSPPPPGCALLLITALLLLAKVVASPTHPSSVLQGALALCPLGSRVSSAWGNLPFGVIVGNSTRQTPKAAPYEPILIRPTIAPRLGTSFCYFRLAQPPSRDRKIASIAC